jgi:hypothetical protein
VEFVLLLGGDDGTGASAAELGARTGRLAAWVSQLRDSGVVREGGRIDGPALRVRSVEGRVGVLDVPAGTAAVRSWLLIDAGSLEAAVAVARTCPETAHGEVRVLPIDPEGRLL